MYFLHIKDLFHRQELRRLVDIADRLNYISGRDDTNQDSPVKKNLQGDPADPNTGEASTTIQKALLRNRMFLEYALPKKMTPPMIARYEPGMNYGEHTDAAVMPANRLTRADISCTVFLSEKDSYEGGELRLRAGMEEITVKGELGSAVLYPTTPIHQVMPVTSGRRQVAVTFIQSQIGDHVKREILYELACVLEEEGDRLSEDAHLRFTNAHTNLHRIWAEI